ncbi:MAG: hypothetical protein MR878_01405 [Campylobacter sp.]|uniref:hypothetical protein n=1 Tax=Campylobacter sp. TaxID=205 RepID=UPI002AA93221|nr:hypothetical protein [Campylobacter sp.]MCI7014029.1 hypothetical protein [Campylobacter sp.]
MFVILLPIFFMIFMVFFPLFWALAICGCWFLPLTKFSKVLISVLILAMLCGGIAFLFFDDEDSVYSFLFACGFISLPVFLYYFWRSQESYENYYHIIHTNPLAKNNLKRRAISLFSIGLLGTFMSLWQLEVPQKVIVNLLPVKLEIVNDDFEYIENPDIDSNLYFEEEKTKKFLNFTYSKINIYACDDFKCKENNRYACDGFGCKGNKKYVGFYWEPWSDASTLGCIFTIINTGSCLRSINRNKRGRDYLMSFIENRKQKNKGKNNE